MEVFKDYAYYYNVFYQNKDYKKEAEQVDTLLKKYGSDVRNIINYGCGTGKHDIELAKMGYQCTGIDLSPLMISEARKNPEVDELRINFSVADIREYVPKQQYDAVISLFHVMSYQSSNIDLHAAFQSARKALKPGGIFLFDVWYGPGVLSDKPQVRVREVEEENHKLIRIARPVMHDRTNLVDVNYELLIIDKETSQVQKIEEVHTMRYFFEPEIELVLGLSGFELLDNIDCQTLEDTGYYTWTSYFVARAR